MFNYKIEFTGREDEELANARLIANAPEMLELLMELIKHQSGYLDDHEPEWLENAETLINRIDKEDNCE